MGPRADMPLPAGVILENTPSSIADVARFLLPPSKFFPAALLSWPLLWDQWLTRDWIAWSSKKLSAGKRGPDADAATRQTLQQPKLRVCLLSGGVDEVVPPACMDSIHAAATAVGGYSSVTFKRFPTGGHMDTYIKGGAPYWQTLRDFVWQPSAG